MYSLYLLFVGEFKTNLLLYFLYFQISGAINWFFMKRQLFGEVFLQGRLEIEAKTLKTIMEVF